MRLIYGLASSMGLGERLAGFLGGIFVPPGADDYGDYGDDFGDYTSEYLWMSSSIDLKLYQIIHF